MSPRAMCARTRSTPASYSARLDARAEASGGSPSSPAGVGSLRGRGAEQPGVDVVEAAGEPPAHRRRARGRRARHARSGGPRPRPSRAGRGAAAAGPGRPGRWSAAAPGRGPGRSRGTRRGRRGSAARRPGRSASRPGGRRRRRATANGSGPAAGASRTATGSAVRYVQRALRPGRALSRMASPGRSRKASAASMARPAAMRSGRRRRRTVADDAGPTGAGRGRRGSSRPMIRPTQRRAGPARRRRARGLPSADASTRLGDHPGPGDPRPEQRHHRRRGRDRRPHDPHRGRRTARRRPGPGPHRRHRRLPARTRLAPRAGLRRLPPPQRQRRADRARVGPRVGHADLADRHHQHAQRRHRPGRARGRVRGRQSVKRRDLVAAGRRRDVRRRAQRHQRLPRPRRAPPRRARGGDRRAGRGGRRRRRDRDDLPRVQGRHRDGVAGPCGRRSAASRSGCSCRRTTASGTGCASTACGSARPSRRARSRARGTRPARSEEAGRPAPGSIIVVVATDAPLLPHQCERLAQRAGLGIARVGGTGGHTSGDLFIAFATGNRLPVGTGLGGRSRRPVARTTSGRSATSSSTGCSRRPSRRPRRPSSTRWSPHRASPAGTASRPMPCRTTDCARSWPPPVASPDRDGRRHAGRRHPASAGAGLGRPDLAAIIAPTEPVAGPTAPHPRASPPYFAHLIARGRVARRRRSGWHGRRVRGGRRHRSVTPPCRPVRPARPAGPGHRRAPARRPSTSDAWPRTTFGSDDPRACRLYVRAGMAALWPNLYLSGDPASSRRRTTT